MNREPHGARGNFSTCMGTYARREDVVIALWMIVGVACGPDLAGTNPFADDDGGLGTGDDGDEVDASTTADAPTTSDDDDDDGAGIKLDVEPPATDGGCVGEACGGPSCTAVDLLFVIDNSFSMEAHQVALAEAFPAFVDAMIAGLPSGTDLHVGVTGTEMGFSAFGVTKSCAATGDDGLPQDDFYVTPDEVNTGTAAAQGRLREVDGLPYFQILTSADPAEIDALEAWFTDAAQIGVGGSTIEMSAAAAGWAADPVNEASNGGFIRDEGAVLVLFFIQDEADQTPVDAADELVAKIAAAKTGCGGLDCVVAGGFVNETCLPQVALGTMLDALPHPPIVQQLPHHDVVSPQTFEALLADTLAEVVAQTCDAIGPAG